MAGRKHTHGKYELRIAEVLQMVCKGRTGYMDIVRTMAKKHDLSEEQIKKDIQEARRRIKEMTHEDMKDEVSDAVMRFKYLIEKNLEEGDYREARNCQAELNKLLGLNEAAKIDVTSKGQAIGMTDDEIKQRIEELKEFKDQTDQ